MYTIIQFSPTGNAAHIASKIKNRLDISTEILRLEHTNSSELMPDDHLILVYAIHAFSAPRTVKGFLKALPEGLYKHVSLIAVGCNTSFVNDAVSKDLRKILNAKGYSIYVDEIIAMPLTFIMAFTEEYISDQLMEADSAVREISDKILNLEITRRPVGLGSHLVQFVGKGESVAARFFGLELHAKKNCTKCGLCVRECPEKNIRMMDDGRVKFGFRCLMCMRCIYNCPVKAITPRLSKFIPISKGYQLKDHLKTQINVDEDYES